MKAIVTVGLGFGDEGKGATVDFLSRQHHAEWVVRYCGGGQAGHNVQLPDGRRHTFSQFGAGALAGAGTYLGPRMIVSPSTLAPEADHLRILGLSDPWSRLVAHPDCLVSTAYHVWMNRIRELARGPKRHGSCGLGVGETRQGWLRDGGDAVVIADLHDRQRLISKLALLRDRLLIECQDLPCVDRDTLALIHQTMPHAEADVLRRASERLRVDATVPRCDTMIFEGAQGLLLDEWKGFHPHTTWSTVTPQHALEMLAELPEVQIEVLGITRAYSTRHGAGPFPTHCPVMSEARRDPGNPANHWQGKMRFGPLDLVLLEYAARVADVDGIVINHLDELPDRPVVATTYQGLSRLPEPFLLRDQEELTSQLIKARPNLVAVDEATLIERVGRIAPVVGTATGPTHLDRNLVETGADHSRDKVGIPSSYTGKNTRCSGAVPHATTADGA